MTRVLTVERLHRELAEWKLRFGAGMIPFDAPYFEALEAGSSPAEANRIGAHALLDAFVEHLAGSARELLPPSLTPCGCHEHCGDDGDVDGPGTCKGLPRAA